MNNQVNYVAVGILMLFGIFATIAFGYWMLKPSDETAVERYLIYFDESVLGLNIDAPVKYKGLSVGKVIKLGIHKEDTQQIEVLVEVLETTPINTTTVAQLTSQGITGLSYINLSIRPNKNNVKLVAKDGEKYPVIRTIPSLLIKFEKTIGDISASLSDTLMKMQELLDSKNQQEFTNLMKNSNALLRDSDHLVQKLDSSLDEKSVAAMRQTMKNMENASRKLDEMMPRINRLVDNTVAWEENNSKSFEAIKNSYAGIQASMASFKNAVDSGQLNIKDITADTIPALNNTLLEMQQLMVKMQDVLEKYEKSPADAIFSQEEIKKGPGE